MKPAKAAIDPPRPPGSVVTRSGLSGRPEPGERRASGPGLRPNVQLRSAGRPAAPGHDAPARPDLPLLDRFGHRLADLDKLHPQLVEHVGDVLLLLIREVALGLLLQR